MQLERLLENLASKHIDARNDWYRWSVNSERVPKGIALPDGTDYEKNSALKLQLHELWKESGDLTRLQLAQYYVATWGGVRRNTTVTLLHYVSAPPVALTMSGPKGVASWSKVLCIRNPLRYAIFDARVSVALNCLQVLHPIRHPVMFPSLPGRNKVIQAGCKRIKDHGNRYGWKSLNSREFYGDYLELLYRVARSIGSPIYAIEMLLFAKAEILIETAFGLQKEGSG